MFSSEAWLSNSGDFYNGVATQSLRFDDGSSSHLSRTPSSAGNRKTWTMSFWVKFSSIKAQTLFATRTNTTPYGEIRFESDGGFFFYGYTGSAYQYRFDTTQLFRDVSAWYHFVFAMDTTQSTESNRTKIYVNGSQITAFDNEIYPTQNLDTNVNTTAEHDIGYDVNASVQAFDGYMAEFNFVDGSQLDPTSFGETKNGVWIPKAYTGSYGTNGFRLEFKNSSVGSGSSSTIGADTSGNANHFSSSGIVASDCNMPDSPENNFCTFNTLDKDSDYTLSEGNLKADSTSSGYGATKSTFAVTSGKWYWEIRLTGTGGRAFIGIAKTTVNPINATNGTADTLFYSGQTGNIWYDGSDQGSYSSTYTTNDIISVALNLDDNEITFYKNGTSGGVAISSIEEGDWTPTVDDGSTSFITSFVANFGQDSSFAGNETAQGNADANDIGDFFYSVPSGYLALCSANLPEPTISPNETTQADDYFNTVLNSGDGSAGSFTGVGFQPDFVWAKNRTNAYQHELWDVIRGVNSTLFSAEAYAEDTTANRLVSFDSDGFSYGTNSNLYVSSTNSVAWCWKAGGTAVSNTNGSITSSVSANTDAGFSIVSYTGNSTAGATVGHGLGSAPNMIMVKCRSNSSSSDHWYVYHSGIASNAQNWEIYLNLNNQAYENVNQPWNNTAPTSSVFSLGSLADVNETSETYIAYCFAEIEGYSKIGSFNTNNNADGTFCYLGFSPSFVMYKSITATGYEWNILDNKRTSYNVRAGYLIPNETAGEVVSANNNVDFLSNGFKLRSSGGDINTSGHQVIYLAYATNPFKYSTAV